MDIIFDIETYPNCFTLAAEHADYPIKWMFEVSEFRDDNKEVIEFIRWIASQKGRMVGFNNVGFDYPVLHTLIQGTTNPISLYQKAISIIGSQDTNRWQHMVYPSDRYCEQIDLYLIHHFDNKARATGLKALEFSMKADNIKDLPFPAGSMLTKENIEVLKVYNAHDVTMTKEFYHKSLKQIAFREELTKKYNRDFMNHNDTKIGKDYFIMKLEESGVQCYTYGPNGRQPKQTVRPVIHLNDVILPWIQFKQPEFQRVLNWLKAQSITETKGVFKDLKVTVNGFEFVFGTGGIHGSVSDRIIESDDDQTILDLDVSSFYPNLSIVNRFRPEHLGETFCTIYKFLYEQRKGYAKGSAENAMLKLALNGTYGDSNNKFSVFYDPLFTMSITLNGQLLLCLLAEMLLEIDGLQLIQANTDGITVKVSRWAKGEVEKVRHYWEEVTGLELEEAIYTKMAIRDVNSYLAIKEDDSVKRKGDYEYKKEWHQDASFLVVPKVVEKVLTEGANIRETVENWPDMMDFMGRIKVPRSSKLMFDGEQIQNTTRYYVAKDGGELIKMMPPEVKKGKTEWRSFQVKSGWKCCVCNDIKDAILPVDYEYYIEEVEKLTLRLR